MELAYFCFLIHYGIGMVVNTLVVVVSLFELESIIPNIISTLFCIIVDRFKVL